MNEIVRYTPVYGNTASGAIATFDTSLALPLQDCTIAINAVQEGSGTPSPDNVRQITGFTGAKVSRTGKNLMPYPYADTTKITAGITFTDNGDGTITANGTNNATSSATFILHNSTTWIPLPKGTYTLSGCPAGGGQNIYRIHAQLQPNSAQDFGNSATFVETDTAKLTTGAIYIAIAPGVTVNNLVFKPQIELGSTATAYEAYGQTYTIPLGQTVYGGLLDVTTGLLTVTHAIDTFNSFALGVYEGNCYRMKNTLSHTPKAGYGNLLCNCFTRATSYTDAVSSVKNSIGYNDKGGILLNYYTDGSYVQNITALNSALPEEGCKIVYELATPQTYQLTPTQISAIVGTNNVFTDTNGDTSVVYACSLKDYIDRQ
jgi:hypothetical protein